MTKYAMAIDLQKCVGCGACGVACKTENNTDFEQDGRKYNWADFYTYTDGTFNNQDVRFHVIPVLCNHCSDAPCVEVCPVTPKAMYKTETGITMHNDTRCIGCQRCIENCPYSSGNVNTSKVQYSVLTYNPEGSVHPFFNTEQSIIHGGTSNPKEVSLLAGSLPPYANRYAHTDYYNIRNTESTEKCIFCDHRLKLGQQPFCVDSCPTGARIFGNIQDSTSEISQAIAKGYSRLKNNKGKMLEPGEKGTSPNVYYLNKFQITHVESQQIPEKVPDMLVFPNPVSTNATIKLDIQSPALVNIVLFDMSGRMITTIATGQRLPGEAIYNFNVSGITEGQYIIRAIVGDQAASTVIVVRK